GSAAPSPRVAHRAGGALRRPVREWMSGLPPYATRSVVQERLAKIFREGTVDNPGYVTRDTASAAVFAMLYVGAVDGTNRYLAPKHVYKMTNDQAARVSDATRLEYASQSLKAGYVPDGTPWYADTSRQPLRDETIRQGL